MGGPRVAGGPSWGGDRQQIEADIAKIEAKNKDLPWGSYTIVRPEYPKPLSSHTAAEALASLPPEIVSNFHGQVSSQPEREEVDLYSGLPSGLVLKFALKDATEKKYEPLTRDQQRGLSMREKSELRSANARPPLVSHESADLIRLTIFHDMATSLAKRTGDDREPSNPMDLRSIGIGPDGVARHEFARTESTAPEHTASLNSWQTDILPLLATHSNRVYAHEHCEAEIRQSFADVLGPSGLTDAPIDRVLDHLKSTFDETRERKGIEAYELGTAAYELYHGNIYRGSARLDDDGRPGVPQLTATQLGEGLASRNLESNKGSRTLDKPLNTLVNDLLHPDIRRRPTPETVAQNPIFSRPGVGSPEVRSLVNALLNGDADEIRQAEANLKEAAKTWANAPRTNG